MTTGNDRLRAVIGSGHAGMAAVINALLDIAVHHPHLASPVQLLVVNTKERQPGPEVPYPMNGIAPDDLHPFATPRPPGEFPTFGEYVRAMSKEDPSLARAFEAPTYGQVTAYLDFMMELAIIAAGEKVDMIPNRRAIDRIDVTDSTGSGVIFFSDRTKLNVTALMGDQPAHMEVWSASSTEAVVAARRLVRQTAGGDRIGRYVDGDGHQHAAGYQRADTRPVWIPSSCWSWTQADRQPEAKALSHEWDRSRMICIRSIPNDRLRGFEHLATMHGYRPEDGWALSTRQRIRTYMSTLTP